MILRQNHIKLILIVFSLCKITALTAQEKSNIQAFGITSLYESTATFEWIDSLSNQGVIGKNRIYFFRISDVNLLLEKWENNGEVTLASIVNSLGQDYYDYIETKYKNGKIQVIGLSGSDSYFEENIVEHLVSEKNKKITLDHLREINSLKKYNSKNQKWIEIQKGFRNNYHQLFSKIKNVDSLDFYRSRNIMEYKMLHSYFFNDLEKEGEKEFEYYMGKMEQELMDWVAQNHDANIIYVDLSKRIAEKKLLMNSQFDEIIFMIPKKGKYMALKDGYKLQKKKIKNKSLKEFSNYTLQKPENNFKIDLGDDVIGYNHKFKLFILPKIHPSMPWPE